ncbi:MAG: rod shape-determining protein MreD [bacterium]|nr:rod shape-determining protein MreD [bacterium]
MSSRIRLRRYRPRRDSARSVARSLPRGVSFLPFQRSVRWGRGLAWLAGVVGVVVLQTSVVGRLQIGGVSPDLVPIVVAYAAFRLRDNGVIVLGFLSGLLLDVSGTSVIGLLAFAMTLVAWGATLTREQGGRGVLVNALRILLLTLAGIAVHTVISIAFGEWSLAIWEGLRRMALIPVLNFVLAVVLFPLSNRLWVPSLK